MVISLFKISIYTENCFLDVILYSCSEGGSWFHQKVHFFRKPLLKGCTPLFLLWNRQLPKFAGSVCAMKWIRLELFWTWVYLTSHYAMCAQYMYPQPVLYCTLTLVAIGTRRHFSRMRTVRFRWPQVLLQQECIPVGCVPSAAVAVSWEGVVCPGGGLLGGVCFGGIWHPRHQRQTLPCPVHAGIHTHPPAKCMLEIHPPPCEQNQTEQNQTGVKTLSFSNFVCGR